MRNIFNMVTIYLNKIKNIFWLVLAQFATIYILSRIGNVRDLLDGFWIGWFDLLTPYTQHSELQAITALSLFSALHSSLQQTHYGSQSSLVVSWQRIYNTVVIPVSHMKFSLHSLIPFLPLFCQLADSKVSTKFNSSAPKLVSWQTGVSKFN
jgi:hypothetical protein